jgi:FkbM family methyltransferase
MGSMRPRLGPAARKLFWRVGRKVYTFARRDTGNDPATNGEYWLLRHVLTAPVPLGRRVLLDVGANKGNWTAEALAVANDAGTEIHVHAFEPAAATRSMLAARFAALPSVTIQAAAMADAPGKATFYTTETGAGTNSLSPASGPNAETTDVSTVDGFLDRSGYRHVSMIKIDTEGFDLLVLRGAARSLASGRIEVVQFEYNWRWLINHASLRDVFALIAGHPYRLGKLIGGGIEFYDSWHFELDRYFEGNYLLVRTESPLLALGSRLSFDASNTPVEAPLA